MSICVAALKFIFDVVFCVRLFIAAAILKLGDRDYDNDELEFVNIIIICLYKVILIWHFN